MKFDFEDVFITGANGWLGRQLIESLINNDKDVLEIDKIKDIKINCLLNENENDKFFLKLPRELQFRVLLFVLNNNESKKKRIKSESILILIDILNSPDIKRHTLNKNLFIIKNGSIVRFN